MRSQTLVAAAVGLSCLWACAGTPSTTASPAPGSRTVPLPQFTADERSRLVGPTTLEAPRIEVDPSAARMRLRGTAIVRGVIGTDGRVQALEALKTLPPTATMELIERGLREARFRPAELNGRPVPIGVVWSIEVDAEQQRVTVGEPGWPAQ